MGWGNKVLVATSSMQPKARCGAKERNLDFMKNKNKDNIREITKGEYESYFGIGYPKNKKLLKAAFKKAWETRNFEIDKFWQRSLFFWGFITLISTGYVIVVTGEFSETESGRYLDFYLILLGIIFSVAWLLAILGSKRWQENWEKHIDYLENEITGPLYKTLYYNGKKYYSVSKINQILACVVLVTWCFLLIQYVYTKNNIFECIFEFISNNFKIIFFIVLPFLGTCFCIVFMFKKGQTSGGDLNAEFKKDGKNVFYSKGLKR
jgi:hypothetical protein